MSENIPSEQTQVAGKATRKKRKAPSGLVKLSGAGKSRGSAGSLLAAMLPDASLT